MGWVYRHLLRPALFTQNPEEIHQRTLRGLAWAGREPLVAAALRSVLGTPPLPVELFGLTFPNPIGLAAGMDKSAEALPAWHALGFGFTELGAVTWHAQPGNPPPRVFRVVAEKAIINRMGFNNPGAEAVAEILERWRRLNRWPSHPVGMNLGKSKVTPLERAAEDYANSFRVLWPYLDFFVINVSSPNTPDLRKLQDKAALDDILAALQQVQNQTAKGAPRKPVLIKVAPDLSFQALDEILELAGPREIAGIVATNTTITRPQTFDSRIARIYSETGGLSGAPLRARSTEVIRHLHRQTSGNLPIIGSGGIFNAADAWEKIAAGATLLQAYTGLVYEGPGLARDLVVGLRNILIQKGMHAMSEAVGCALPGPAVV